MPEGHTIHRLARDHNKWYAGQKMAVLSPQGRFAEGAEELNGRKLQTVEAHGKHLFYRWSGGRTLHIHLGLYGKFRQHKLPPPEPRGAVRLRAIGKEKAFDLNGPNACHLITGQELAAIRGRLGPDPLRDDSDPQTVFERIGRSRAAIGALLLNQEVIAGVGNIYRSEVLFLLGIHPETAGRDITAEQFEELWSRLQTLMELGVRHNRIIIADPKEVGKPASRMTRQERLLVYKHDECGRCGAGISCWELGARTVYACEECQT